MINLYTKNLKSLGAPIMMLWMAVQNAENGVVRGHSRHGQCHSLIERMRLSIQLLQKLTNYVAVLDRFRDTASCLSKVANLTYPTCIWCPHWGWPWWNFSKIFGIGKLQSQPSCGFVCVILIPVFSRFSRRPTCDRWTHGHSIYRASIAACSKNEWTRFLPLLSIHRVTVM